MHTHFITNYPHTHIHTYIPGGPNRFVKVLLGQFSRNKAPQNNISGYNPLLKNLPFTIIIMKLLLKSH